MIHRTYKTNVTAVLACICLIALLQGWCRPLVAQGKTHTNLLTQEEIDRIRKQRSWTGVSVENALSLANKWMKYSIQELRDKVPPASVPRAFDVHFNQDPLHPEQIKAVGSYPWIIDPDLPYKVKCPVGGEIYPTNDFDPKNVGKPSEVSSEPYVDNGWGWRKPGDPQKYWFVAYYAHWLYMDHLQPAAVALAQAYVITGDRKYARQAAALLDRIAEEYPKMEYVSQSRYGTEIQPGNYHGRIVNSIWETGLVKSFVTAYDYIYPALEHDPELEKAIGKSGAEIRRNIEQGILEEAARSIHTADGRIRGNFGMHQSALALIAIVLDNADTEKYLDTVLNDIGLTNWQYQGVVTGLANLVFRDGAPNESSPGYNSLWVSQFDQVAVQLLRRGVNLYQQEPKLKALFDYPLRLVMAGKFTPNIGDTGSVTSSGIVGWNANTYATAYRQYGEDAYAYGKPLTEESDNLSAYGMALLRTGSGAASAGVSLYYGPGGGHDHYDRLNLELFAKGLRISPDLGYPEYASAQDKSRHAFVGHTISHNTVLVNQQRQSTKNGGKIRTFNASPEVQFVDVSAEEAYPGMVEQYRRSVVLIDASDVDSYVVDVFRVSGGNQHDYSLHGPDGVLSVQNLDLTKRAGTLAGESVPYRYLYDAPALERAGYSGGYSGYTGSGFSYLTNVERGVPNGIWDADWAVKGSNAHLRVTFVPQPGGEVFLADGQPPQNKVGNPPWMRYVIARNKAPQGGKLDSTFVTVWQPYTDKPFINKVANLADPARGTDTVALQIDHTQGTDYVFQAVADETFQAEAGNIRFSGKLGVLSRSSGGVLRHANLVGGGVLRLDDILVQAAGSYTGEVLAVDYENSKVTLKLAPTAPAMPIGDVLAQQRIVFSNANHATEYVVAQVKALGDRVYEIGLVEKELQTGRGLAGYVSTTTVNSKTQLVLNQYYLGQRMVNPKTGQGSRIKSVSGSGSSFTLESGILGLKTDDPFHIFDFGPGDQFTLAGSIAITAESDGVYTVKSNVSGQVVLWDGISHEIAPGTSRIAIPVIDVRIAKPEAGAKVGGVLQPQFALDIPAGLALTRFSVQMDGREVYNGAGVPADLAIDTALYEDGQHVLSVSAADQYGKATTRSANIKVENWWEIKTELPPIISSGWFGTVDFTHIYEKSTGWVFVDADPANFANDIDRMTREKNGAEYIIWETPHLSRFDLKVFAKSGLSMADVSLGVSADGSVWRPVAFRAEPGITTAAGWREWHLTADALTEQEDIRFFRVVLPASIPAADMQIGAVALHGKTDPATLNNTYE